MSYEALKQSIAEQLQTLAAVTEFVHVKPHGALYNQAAVHREIARVIADAVAEFSRDLLLVGLAGSVMLEEFAATGFRVAAEAFADRRYERDGMLRSRTLPGAVIESFRSTGHPSQCARTRSACTATRRGRQTRRHTSVQR
jgi:5-oxoprolinase (ATP-hydrolysing) subunit A